MAASWQEAGSPQQQRGCWSFTCGKVMCGVDGSASTLNLGGASTAHYPQLPYWAEPEPVEGSDSEDEAFAHPVSRARQLPKTTSLPAKTASSLLDSSPSSSFNIRAGQAQDVLSTATLGPARRPRRLDSAYEGGLLDSVCRASLQDSQLVQRSNGSSHLSLQDRRSARSDTGSEDGATSLPEQLEAAAPAVRDLLSTANSSQPQRSQGSQESCTASMSPPQSICQYDSANLESQDWAHSQWHINPEAIFFSCRSNGKLCRLGKGAFGTVYKGMLEGQQVAVKVCKQAALAKGRSLRQFQKEVAILQACDHPHIVRFVGACTWKGGKRTVLVTEFMEKGDLCSLLARSQERFKWAGLGARIALDIALGLQFMHHRKIAHFDLKSANVLLDRHYRAKLADVGLARALHNTHEGVLSTIMQTGSLGTFAYSSNEVLLGKPAGLASDIYSFGVLCTEICTGETPTSRDFRMLSVPDEGPAELRLLVNACLQSDPLRRPSANRLVKVLQALQC